MVFLGGPRQVGKTTLAKRFLGTKKSGGYLNWDVARDREAILKGEMPVGNLWVFDEIHKYFKLSGGIGFVGAVGGGKMGENTFEFYPTVLSNLLEHIDCFVQIETRSGHPCVNFHVD